MANKKKGEKIGTGVDASPNEQIDQNRLMYFKGLP